MTRALTEHPTHPTFRSLYAHEVLAIVVRDNETNARLGELPSSAVDMQIYRLTWDALHNEDAVNVRLVPRTEDGEKPDLAVVHPVPRRHGSDRKRAVGIEVKKPPEHDTPKPAGTVQGIAPGIDPKTYVAEIQEAQRRGEKLASLSFEEERRRMQQEHEANTQASAAAIDKVAQQYRAEVERLTEHAERLADRVERLEAKNDDLRDSRDRAVNNARAEERASFEAQLQTKENAYKADIDALRAEHKRAITELQDRHEAEITRTDRRHGEELKRVQDDLQRERERHAEQDAKVAKRHEDQIADLNKDHKRELAKLREELDDTDRKLRQARADLQAERATRDAETRESQRTIISLESDLRRARSKRDAETGHIHAMLDTLEKTDDESKKEVIKTVIHRKLGVEPEKPDPFDKWLDTANNLLRLAGASRGAQNTPQGGAAPAPQNGSGATTIGNMATEEL